MTAHTPAPADTMAGATSHAAVDWHAIDWRQAHRIVRRLQARIVQATKDGKHNKARALQRLLTHSFSGKALAVKRVTENHGKKTPAWIGSSGTRRRRRRGACATCGSGATAPSRSVAS